MTLNELRLIIRKTVASQLAEAKQKSSTPRSLSDFRTAVATALKKVDAPKDFVDEVADVGNEGGGVFQAIWDTWRNLEAEMQYLPAEEAAAVYRDEAPGYVHDMVLDMVDAYQNAYNYEPGRKPSKIDGAKIAVRLEAAMFPPPKRSPAEKKARELKDMADLVFDTLEMSKGAVSNIKTTSSNKVTYDVMRSDYLEAIAKSARKGGLKPVEDESDYVSSEWIDDITGLTVHFGDGVATIK